MRAQQYLGKYKLLECLGKGGMAEVWKALDLQLQRLVAIKIPHPDLQANAEFLARFKQEGRIIASLRHPNIMKIHGFEIAPHPESNSPIAYIVLEYIEGQTLAEYLNSPSHKGKFLSRADIMHLFTAISLAIDYAHQGGMLHRDIKPANILLDRRNASLDPDAMGEPILTDFGIAKLLGTPSGDLTRYVIGTPLYMSPEQGQGASGDERSDIYSLGVILYEICTGKLPFQGGAASIIVQKISASPPPPRQVNPNIQPALASVILRSLAKDPAARYPSASSLAADLKKALSMPGQRELGPLIRLHPGPSSPPEPTQPELSLPPTPRLSPIATKKPKKSLPLVLMIILLIALTVMLLTPLVGSRLVSLFFPTNQVVGEASFRSSGQFDEKTGTGINDMLQIDFHDIPDPAPGKSYYVWLLEDKGHSDPQALLLKNISVTQGVVHGFYRNPKGNNLLYMYSGFLITEEDAHTTPVGPSPDLSMWKYSAELPQTPDPKDTQHHYSVLDHLRHLLAWEPALQAQNFPGGLDIWLYTNTGKVADKVGRVGDDWDNQSIDDLRQQLILILDCLDGRAFVQQDLPPNTSLPANVRFDYFGLLGKQNQEPRGLLNHINTHLRSLTQAPGATSKLVQKANQISMNINQVQQWLEMVREDAKVLLQMDDTQLLSLQAKAKLDNMKAQAGYAYNGLMDQEGVRQIDRDIQGLATFEVQPYIPR